MWDMVLDKVMGVLYFAYNLVFFTLSARMISLSADLTLFVKNFVISRIFKVNLKKKYGPWAVVTGGTDGIGKAYAYELAKRGINIILISKTMEKLQAVSANLESKYGIETDILQIDFSSKEIACEEIEKRLSQRDIGILVNNVGVGYGTVKPFYEVPDNVISQHMSVNMGAPTFMAKIVAPAMLERKKGAIINVSSLTGLYPHPYLAIYSATKAYNRHFSSIIGQELENITVQTVTPWFVCTSLGTSGKLFSKPSIICPSARTFVASALCTLGYTDNTCGYSVHELLKLIFFDTFPDVVKVKITKMVCGLYIKFCKKRNVKPMEDGINDQDMCESDKIKF